MFEGNRLLSAVEPAIRLAFAGRVQRVELARGAVLLNPGETLERVHFPLGGLIGILAQTADGDAVDCTSIGREGAVGAFEACGTRLFHSEAIVQITGEAVRMQASTYRDLFAASATIRTAIHCYVEEMMSETRQSVACNALHAMEARLARILLETIDKSGLSNRLPLLQRTLAQMLGAQRSTIAEALSKLQRQGILRSQRGAIVLVDRARLEALACSCRAANRFTRQSIAKHRTPSCEQVIAA